MTAGLIVVYLAAAALGTFERVRNPAEFLYGEAIVLDETRRIGLGLPLYPAPSGLPLTSRKYTGTSTTAPVPVTVPTVSTSG